MKLRFYILSSLLTIFILTGCSPTRHLSDNEYLLYRVKLQGVEKNDPYAISSLYKQEPNTRIPGTGIMPFLSLYYLGKKFYKPHKIEKRLNKTIERFDKKIQRAGDDSTKVEKKREKKELKVKRLTKKKEEGNILMRKIGEKPTIYDSVLTEKTIEQISVYLDSKGFFNNTVTADPDTSKKKITLKIKVNEHKPYKLTHITYGVKDSSILSHVLASKKNSLLKEGDNYDEDKISRERDRLELLLKNRGYYAFQKQFITFEVDTSYGGHSVRIKTIIGNPEKENHQVYKIRNVYFLTDAGTSRFGINRDTIHLKNVNYLAYSHYVSSSILDKKLYIYPGQKYNYDQSIKTQRQLSDLDLFRYNNINYSIIKDTTDHFLDTYINAAPANKYQATSQAGINLTEQIPGPFVNFRLKVRNVFGGAQVLDLGVRGGFEGQYSPTTEKAELNREFGGNAAFIFPDLFVPERFERWNPKTRINSGFTFTERVDYTRTNVDLNMSYILLRSQKWQFFFTPLDINIVNTPKISPQFASLLDSLSIRGVTLRQSFSNSFVSSMHFTSIYNTNNFNQTKDARLFRTFTEVGGLTDLLLNYKVGNLQVFNFAKTNIDYRRYHKLEEQKFFVYRFNTGIAVPLGGSKVLPYEKFFFAGGGSSIRAWRPRKLGPGSFGREKANGERDFDQEQPGEILLETSAEYRFNIFGFVNGAFFLDAGNIWTIKEDASRPGAQIKSNFYKELALGTGFGLRFDFTFLILRLDIAAKVYDPRDKFIIKDFNVSDLNVFGPSSKTIINIGIGYPW